ncbi:MAG TPA: enterobactin synthase subunit EntD, partial [Atlantibacter hermannii]|nr:enterobactin synthase subunit EntD [Atlantibacter hermannii]
MKTHLYTLSLAHRTLFCLRFEPESFA